MKILPNNDRLHLECAAAENTLCSITEPAEQVSSLHEIGGGTYLRLQPLDEQRNVADRVPSEVDMFQRYEQAGLVKPGATGKRSRQDDAAFKLDLTPYFVQETCWRFSVCPWQ